MLAGRTSVRSGLCVVGIVLALAIVPMPAAAVVQDGNFDGLGWTGIYGHETIGTWFDALRFLTVKYAGVVNFPWLQIGTNVCGMYDWVPDTGYPTKTVYANRIVVYFLYSARTCGSLTNAQVTVTGTFYNSGYMTFQVYSSPGTGSYSRIHYTYMDWAVGDSGVDINSPNYLRFHGGGNTGAISAGRYTHEDYTVGGPPFPSDYIKWYVSNDAGVPVGGLVRIDGGLPDSTTVSRLWVNKCTSCAATSNSQYTNGPSQYDNDEGIDGVDLHTVHRYHQTASVSNGWSSVVLAWVGTY